MGEREKNTVPLRKGIFFEMNLMIENTREALQFDREVGRQGAPDFGFSLSYFADEHLGKFGYIQVGAFEMIFKVWTDPFGMNDKTVSLCSIFKTGF